MSMQRGTPRRGSGGRGKTQDDLSMMVEEGYEVGISMPDDWEARLVNGWLATGRGGGKINHYWILKNMMGVLMEDKLSN